MAFCNNCGRELRNGVKFCEVCGAPVSSVRTSQAPNLDEAYRNNVHRTQNINGPSNKGKPFLIGSLITLGVAIINFIVYVYLTLTTIGGAAFYIALEYQDRESLSKYFLREHLMKALPWVIVLLLAASVVFLIIYLTKRKQYKSV